MQIQIIVTNLPSKLIDFPQIIRGLIVIELIPPNAHRYKYLFENFKYKEISTSEICFSEVVMYDKNYVYVRSMCKNLFLYLSLRWASEKYRSSHLKYYKSWSVPQAINPAKTHIAPIVNNVYEQIYHTW